MSDLLATVQLFIRLCIETPERDCWDEGKGKVALYECLAAQARAEVECKTVRGKLLRMAKEGER